MSPEYPGSREEYNPETVVLLGDIDTEVFDSGRYQVSAKTGNEIARHLRDRGVEKTFFCQLPVKNSYVAMERRLMKDGGKRLHLGGGASQESLISYDSRFEGKKVYWGIELDLDESQILRAQATMPREEDEYDQISLSNNNLEKIAFAIHQKMEQDRQ